MKKRLLLGPGLVLAVLVSLLGAQAIAAGGGSDTLAISPIGQELEGTWLTRVGSRRILLPAYPPASPR